MKQRRHHVIEMRVDDPDRPFRFSAYVAIASYIRHHERCSVRATVLPYGMWWQQLRPDIDLTIGPIDGPADEPDGVWIAPGKWISADHHDYLGQAADYHRAAWLDAQSES